MGFIIIIIIIKPLNQVVRVRTNSLSKWILNILSKKRIMFLPKQCTNILIWYRFVLPKGLLKYVSLINKFEDGLKVKSWTANSAATRAMLAEISTGNERNFLVDIPTWQVRDFLVMVSRGKVGNSPHCHKLNSHLHLDSQLCTTRS